MPQAASRDHPQQEIITFLESPSTHGGAKVERIDTHIAHVFLVKDRAYKLKRSVKLPYLDFSTLAKRLRAAQAELRLNRITAPDLYLGLQALYRSSDGKLSFGETSGEIVEWLIVMRRFEQRALFDAMAQNGHLSSQLIVALADEVLNLHRYCPQVVLEAPDQHFATIVHSSLEELRSYGNLFVDRKLDHLTELVGSALKEGAKLLLSRAARGQVRRCHGDLHLQNVVLWRGKPLIFDALEFDDALATGDTLYDIAFLLMDLEHRGLRELGNRLFCRITAQTNEYDDAFPLLPLFIATRAMIRAKISATLAASSKRSPQRAQREREAQQYLNLALDCFRPATPCLTAIGGLSGSGKSTVAYQIAPRLGRLPGAVVLRSDEERKRLLGSALEVPLPQEAYNSAMNDRVYQSLRERAAIILESGQSVIVDAVLASESERKAIQQVAGRHTFKGVWLEAPADSLRRRVSSRTGDASDATEAVVDEQLDYSLGNLAWDVVDAQGSPAAVAESVLCHLKNNNERPSPQSN